MEDLVVSGVGTDKEGREIVKLELTLDEHNVIKKATPMIIGSDLTRKMLNFIVLWLYSLSLDDLAHMDLEELFNHMVEDFEIAQEDYSCVEIIIDAIDSCITNYMKTIVDEREVMC